MKPERLVLSRARGFNLDAVSRARNGLPAQSVARPGKWGNPFVIADIAAETGLGHDAAQAEAVSRYRLWVEGKLDPRLSPGEPPDPEAIRVALGGKNLACWCRQGTPCHADVLIALANP